MHPVRSTFRKLSAIDWRGVIGDIIVTVTLVLVVALIVGWYFRIPEIAHAIFDPLFRAGEWCYVTYHAERGLFIAGATGLVLVLGALAGWYYIIIEPRREEQRKWENYIDYIERTLRDPELMEIWVTEGSPEKSHEQRAGNSPSI